MPKEYDLEFQPSQRRRRDQMARFALGFGAILLLLFIASAFALQRDGFLDRLLNKPTEPETTVQGAWPYQGSAVLLLCETDNAGQSLRFVMLVRVDAQRRQVHIFPLLPQARAPYGGREITLEQALREGGVKALKAAAEALTETEIDRYIAGDDDAFVKTINTMGSVTVQLGQRVRYRKAGADFTLTLAEGSQRLQGDMLLRYFRYLGALGEEPPLQQGALLKTVLETYLTAKNGESPAVLEQRFASLANLLQTDISVTDFFRHKDLLLALLAESEKIELDVKE